MYWPTRSCLRRRAGRWIYRCIRLHPFDVIGNVGELLGIRDIVEI